MQTFTVENVAYQRDKNNNIRMVKFRLKELKIDYKISIEELFFQNGDVVFAGFFFKGKTIDLHQLSYLYSINHKKLYLPIRLSLEQSIRHKLLKIVAIIIFLTLLFLGFSIGATFTNQGTISWQGQIDLLTSTTAKLIFAGISVFSILFVIFDNSNFNFLKIQELKSIRSDEISTYERNLEILSIYPLFYDFNLKNELKYKSGILQEIYYSDKETGLICIVVEGITYYFISDYLGFKKAEEIQFYYSQNNKMIFVINTRKFLYLNLGIQTGLFKSASRSISKLFIFISLLMILVFLFIGYFYSSVGGVEVDQEI